MTKQEEIREGAIISLMDYKGFHKGPTEYIIDYVFKYLHSRGVVIKVKRELPELSWRQKNLEDGVEVQQDMLKAGYIAVEPLIK